MSVEQINQAYFTESGAIYVPEAENPEYYDALRDEMGKRRLDHYNYNEYGYDNRTYQQPKERLNDRDGREIAVGIIDEKRLDLEDGDTASTANLKARNGLAGYEIVYSSFGS